MADGPSKSDITAIFKRLRSIPTNKACFDCSSNNPTWASVTYGVFLCIDCSAVHRSLGVHVTFIRSTQLDTSWTWLQLRAMQVGGNANATAFFRQHGCTTTDAQQKYHSRAAKLYKDKLHSLATNAMRLHGTKLHIDSHHEPTSPTTKEELDFFKEHVDSIGSTPIAENQKLSSVSEPQPIKNGNLKKEEFDPSEGPSVEAALSMSPTTAAAQAEPRKAIIGAKKPAGRKGKGGLGAQRVKANFSEIENKAQQLDKEREELAATRAIQEAKSEEEKAKQMASMRLAYQDMNLERKKQEDKLKQSDPKKAEQLERLGMGFASSKGMSHSAMTDMQVIEQEQPNSSRSKYDQFDRKPSKGRSFFDDELDDYTSSSKYDRDFDFDKKDSFSSWGNNNKSGSWDIDRFDSKQSFSETMSSKPKNEDKQGRSRKTYDYGSQSSSEEAQKKFGNAKSISSDQFFGNSDPDFETRQNLSRFEGSNSISSSQLFGTESTGRKNYSSNAPDLQDIRDGVRQGVTKVAGKLSNLASGVMSSLQIFRWFQKLGLCKGIKGSRIAVDKICTEFDHNIKTWKNSIQMELGHPLPEHGAEVEDQALSESESELSESTRSSSDSDDHESEVDISSEDDDEIFPLPSDEDSELVPTPSDDSSLLEEDNREAQNPGYSLCWDNVQRLCITRHHLRQENKMMLWALCFATKNRISFRHLDAHENRCSVRDIEMHNYLPSVGDWKLLRSRMEHVVKDILCRYFPQFSDIQVNNHTHQYSEISARKSEIVNLGVIRQNPSSARGTLEIMKILHEYVPNGRGGQPYPILCHGDQLSVERMVEAKLSMAFSEDPDDQLTGLIPRPQGFHKRCIILQDSMNMLFDGRTVGDKGSLCHIKNMFGFRTVKKKISDCVNSVVDFFNFITEASVCMITCSLLNLNDIDDILDDLPQNEEDRNTFLDELSGKVVSLAWPQVDTESIRQATVGAGEIPEPIDDEDNDGHYLDDTVLYWEDGHELEETLPYYTDSEEEFDEPDECGQDSRDSVLNYSRCMLWRGLLHMVQTYAERHNNGEHIIADWRLDMVEFWNKNHNKYLILGHRLLAGVSGCLPPRLRNEVIWNSTANLVGKPGHNIALDLVNEFLNNEFKSNLNNCHGQYTDAQVSRCSKIVGSIGKAVEEIFSTEDKYSG